MSINDFEPLFGEWYVVSLIGAGTFGKVYKIKREEYKTSYFSALKWISIPSNKSEIKSLCCDGMDADSISGYFNEIVQDLTNEIQLMSRLRGQSSIVSYEDHKIIPKSNGIGFDIFIRMELLTSLSDHMLAHPYSSEDIIHLGINICEALELCQKYNIIHRDIKPDNIFVTELGDYKLGDFGIARQLERTMSNMSTKGTFNYMAPEVYKQLRYDSSVDLYSLGIVLYRLFNNGRLPFLPLAPNPIRPADRDESIIRRLSGEPMPFPQNAAGRLGEIILKACAYDPKDRYSSPKHMRLDLQAIQLQPSKYNNSYEEIDNTQSIANTTPRPDKKTTQTIGDIGRVSESTFAAQLNMREKDLNKSRMQEARAHTSYTEKTTITEDLERERVMSKEATLRRREETKKQQERIRKRKEEKLNKILNAVIFSLIGCAAVFGIVLATKLISKDAIGRQALNAVSATNIEVGTDSLNQSNSSNDKLDVTATQKESITSSATPLSSGRTTTPTPTSISETIYGDWSIWSDTRPADKGERVVEKRYSKKARETKTSLYSSDAINGWQIIDSKEETNYGEWSDWSTTACNSSSTQEIETRTSSVKYTEYKLFHYEVNFEDGNKTYLPCECNARIGTPWDWAWNGGSSYCEVVSNSYQTNWVDDLPGYNTRECDQCGQQFCDYWGLAWFSKIGGPETRTVEGDPITEYRSRSITTTTTYYLERWTDWSDWQTTAIIADSNTQVRVQYRYRDELS